MPTTFQALGIDRLDVAERVALVQEIWDSIAGEAELSPPTEGQQQEVDRRWAAHLANPDGAIPWEQVEVEALARLRRWAWPSASSPEARAEFDDAADRYERQQVGLGLDFVACVRQVLDRIAANPQLHAAIHGPVRKVSVSRFPYVVLDREEPGEVVVVSVFHTSRDPSIWRGRA